MATHERVWEQGQSRRPFALQEWKPKGTHWLLGIIGGVFVLQVLTLATAGRGLHEYVFVINTDWPLRPWTLVTSTLSHGDFRHILFNGLFLYFFGQSVERILGTKRYLWLFVIAGAVSGVLQVHLSAAYGTWSHGGDWMAALVPGAEPGMYSFPERNAAGQVVGCTGACGALGASGSLMMMFGVLLALMPKAKIMLLFPPIPLPLWVMGAFYIALDLFGAFTPGGNVGNFAHLSGMAIGFLYGKWFKQQLAERGMRLQYT